MLTQSAKLFHYSYIFINIWTVGHRDIQHSQYECAVIFIKILCMLNPGLEVENGFQKSLGFLGFKNLKSPKFRYLLFLVKFYAEHI